ncbi:MAG: ABC transporter ATP-binding protein [Gemmatimonadota bacterium]
MSSDRLALALRGVSKTYRIATTRQRHTLFGEAVVERLKHPLRRAPKENFDALVDVSVDVRQGEILGMIGRNGAGKSTLLKILSRITNPTGGRIEVYGRLGSLLEVGTGFHPELTGRENIYLNGAVLGMKRREITRRFESIVEFAEVTRFLDTPVKRYSSGMYVRLAFAVAAHLDPEILLVDEVLSVGDANFQAKCLDKMKSIGSEQGRTVMYVSHNLVTVEHLCRRTLLLVDGRLAFDGNTEETVSKYLHMFPSAERGLTPGVFDLAAADRSEGGYDKVFKRLEFRPSGGAPSDTIRMGERLQIEITAEGLDAIPQATMMVTVGSSLSPCVFSMTSRMLPLEAAQTRRAHEKIVLDIPSLPVTPGEYHLVVQVKDRNETIDFVRRAGNFTVIPADVLGTGYQFAAHDGQFLVPWEWEIRPSNTDV